MGGTKSIAADTRRSTVDTKGTMTTVTEGTKITVEDMVPRMARVTEDKSTVVDTDLTVVGTEVKSTVVHTAADMEVNNTVATTKDTSNTVKTLMVPTEISSIILRLTLTFNKHLLNTTIKMSLTKGTKRPEISLRLQKRTNPKTSAFHSLPNTS